MVELPFLKITYLIWVPNIRKTSAQRRILFAKTYEQQTKKNHLTNSKKFWNLYIWVASYSSTYLNKKNKVYTGLNI